MYIQLDNNNNFAKYLPDGDIEFSDTVLQPASTLTPEQAAKFRVHPVVSVDIPRYDPISQVPRQGAAVLVSDTWYQTWDIIQLPDDVVSANQAAYAHSVREAAKAARKAAVDAIKVTISNGWTFDGDEDSQTRMSRAIIGMLSSQTESNGPVTINWVLADNSVVQVTAAELTEALTLAGLEQARLWVIE